MPDQWIDLTTGEVQIRMHALKGRKIAATQRILARGSVPPYTVKLWPSSREDSSKKVPIPLSAASVHKTKTHSVSVGAMGNTTDSKLSEHKGLQVAGGDTGTWNQVFMNYRQLW